MIGWKSKDIPARKKERIISAANVGWFHNKPHNTTEIILYNSYLNAENTFYMVDISRIWTQLDNSEFGS